MNYMKYNLRLGWLTYGKYFWMAGAALGVFLGAGWWTGAAESRLDPWVAMDYGPAKTHSLEVSPGNIANKGLAIRVDHGPGGITQGENFLLFETDTLRYAGGWTGPGFNDWRNIMHNGEHRVHASIVGELVFQNPDAPGWADPDGRFRESRFLGRDGRRYGPIPMESGRWNGHYLYGDRVVLSYTVGETAVLDMPGAEERGRHRFFSRTLHFGPRPNPLVMQVAWQKDTRAEKFPAEGSPGAGGQLAWFPPVSVPVAELFEEDKPWINLDGETCLVMQGSRDVDLTASGLTFYAQVRTRSDGTIFSVAPPRGQWVPFAKSLFLRHGHPTFDIGWVGDVESETSVNDGRWHRIAMSYDPPSGRVKLFVDGNPAGDEILAIPGMESREGRNEVRDALQDHLVRLGYTSPNFPRDDNESWMRGSLGDVRLYLECLPESELRTLGRRRSEYDDPRLWARWDFRNPDRKAGRVPDIPESGHAMELVSRRAPEGSPTSGPERTLAAVVGGPQNLRWEISPDGNLRLEIPAGPEPALMKVLIGRVPEKESMAEVAALISGSSPPEDPGAWTGGGPPRWTQIPESGASVLGGADGPFLVESIDIPWDNPYGTMFRTSGFDFFPGGDRAAICTVMGDVWLVDGLGGSFSRFHWKRIATGMYEPLGLKIVDGAIYVTCRDQITRLHDLNGDEEIDFYEAFHHGSFASEHYHEFAMCLETDAAGNFYYVKAAGHDMEARFPQHGTIIKVSPDGRTSEIYASGFRAPNGLWVSPDGSYCLSTDQEGHWTPENRINWIEPGKFYGYMLGWHEEGRKASDFTPPLCWIHKQFDNSPSRVFYIESDRWGPLNGTMASISYGTGKIYHVNYERASNGLMQGGITELPAPAMPTGLERARFNPLDDQLYLCGLFVWSSNQTQPGGFYRVSYTGKSIDVPLHVAIARDGAILRFSHPLDAESAADPGNYSVEMWQYQRRRSYGSPDIKVLGKGEGRDTLRVASASLSSDQRSVFLEIPQIQPVPQFHITINIRDADGRRIRTYAHQTIHALGKRAGRDMLENP